jgi:hypothetical protein
MVGRGTSSKAMESDGRCRAPFKPSRNRFWMDVEVLISESTFESSYSLSTSSSSTFLSSYIRAYEPVSAEGSLNVQNCASGSRSLAYFVRDLTSSNLTSSALSLSEFFPVKEVIPAFFLKVTFLVMALLAGSPGVSSTACCPRAEGQQDW